jgi:hypothetical protein
MTTAPTSFRGSSRAAAVVLTVLLALGVAAMAAALALGALAVRSALATGACIEGGSSPSGLPCPKGLIPSIPMVDGVLGGNELSHLLGT